MSDFKNGENVNVSGPWMRNVGSVVKFVGVCPSNSLLAVVQVGGPLATSYKAIPITDLSRLPIRVGNLVVLNRHPALPRAGKVIAIHESTAWVRWGYRMAGEQSEYGSYYLADLSLADDQ
jgi:hypothetical protein